MALYNLGGDAKPICKYDAKQGIITIDKREMPFKDLKAIFDLETLEVGWIHFTNGPPTFLTVPALDQERAAALERPATLGKDGKPAYKWGYRGNIKLTKELAGNSPSVREYSSNSYLAFNGMDDLMEDWLAQRVEHLGKLPVVVGKRAVEVSGGSGKNYQPVYAIVDWIDPPEDLVAMRNGKAPSDGGNVPAQVVEVEDEPEAIEPVDFSEDGSDF